MLIVCPSCATAYRIELSTLGASGRSVRCGRCRTVWFASVADVASATIEVPLGPDGSGSGIQSYWPPSLPSGTAGGGSDDAGSDFAIVERSVGDVSLSSGATADPVAMADAPPLIPSIMHDPTHVAEDGHATAPAGKDIETFAARRARLAQAIRKRRWHRGRRPGLPAVILALVAVLSALINWRASVVHLLPQTASFFSAVGLPVNLRGLAFDKVKTSVEAHEGLTVLVLEGTIVSVGRQAVEVPRLRFAVRNSAGYEVYAWTGWAAHSVLAPGDTVPFRTRLASPPADGREVVVRFFNRRDVVAGSN